MGMYTGLRVDVELKPEYVPMIQALMNHKRTQANDFDEWEHASKFAPEDIKENVLNFANYGRCTFIPYGVLAYMPWDDNDEYFGKRRLEGNRWIFQCSLQNYEDEIDVFLYSILCKIVGKAHHVEELYEEWGHSKMYDIEDGDIKEVEGISYGDEDE